MDGALRSYLSAFTGVVAPSLEILVVVSETVTFGQVVNKGFVMTRASARSLVKGAALMSSVKLRPSASKIPMSATWGSVCRKLAITMGTALISRSPSMTRETALSAHQAQQVDQQRSARLPLDEVTGRSPVSSS